MPNGHTNNSPESGRGLGHVTPTIFDIRSNISLKLLEIETSNLVCSFVWSMPSRRTNNFPWKWAWPRSLDPYNFGSTVGYPSDSLASCYISDVLCDAQKQHQYTVQCTTQHLWTKYDVPRLVCMPTASGAPSLCPSSHESGRNQASAVRGSDGQTLHWTSILNNSYTVNMFM